MAPDEAAAPTGGDQAGQDAEKTEPTDAKKGKETPTPKEPRRTRGMVFAEMLRNSPEPGTRKQWAERYLEAYGGSAAESAFRIGCFVDLLHNMGLMRIEKGVITYIG